MSDNNVVNVTGTTIRWLCCASYLLDISIFLDTALSTIIGWQFLLRYCLPIQHLVIRLLNMPVCGGMVERDDLTWHHHQPVVPVFLTS